MTTRMTIVNRLWKYGSRLLLSSRAGSRRHDWPTTMCQSVRCESAVPLYNEDYYRYLSDNRQLSNSPLHGIRVLDMSRILAGPFCSMILGDMGAEVIKVEKPGSGDDTRSWGPPWVGDESAYFLSVNRNKKSIAVDVKTPAGLEIIRELIRRSDVLVENYLPDKLAELQLDYDSVSQVRPSLVYCSITGFGESGPYAKRGGYDNIAIAIGGLMHITGPENGEPCRTGVAVVDLSTGLYAVGAILAALIHQKKTGRGQHVRCNLLSTQLSLLSHIASNWLNCGVESKRWGTAHPSLVPYEAFATKDDRRMLIGAGSEKHFKELCQRLDLADLAHDDRFNINSKRVANRQLLISRLSSRFLEKTLDEWMSVFEGVAFPYGPINNIQQAFSDPQVLHNQSVQQMFHPFAGNIRLSGPAVQFSDSANVLQCPPPALGEHTRIVLHQELRYPLDKVEQLRRDRIIQCVDC